MLKKLKTTNRHDFVYISILFATVLTLLPFCVKPVWAVQTTSLSLPVTDAASIDQCNPNNTYASGYVLNYYNFFNLLGCGQSRLIETWLKFDTSSIPPQATILSATLSETLSVAYVYSTVGAYSVSSDSWTGTSITWNNAPRSSVSSTPLSSQYVTNSTTFYTWNVVSAVSGAISSGTSLTLVLLPTASQGSNINGWIEFFPSSTQLRITYSYASATVSLSTNQIQFGNFVTITGSTDPPQSGGTYQLQYSTDQSTWLTIGIQSGGSLVSNWAPPSVGTFYVRGIWQMSWNNGADSYTATSGVWTLVVNPASSTTLLTLSQNTVVLGNPVTLNVLVSPSSVSDGTVTLQYSTDDVTWNTVSTGTPVNGRFSGSWTADVTGTYYIRAIWSGDSNYQGSTSAVQTLLVQEIPTSIALTSPSTSQLDQTITIIATLKDNSNNPIQGAEIEFRLDSMPIGAETTNVDGSATLVYTLSANAGAHVISASYSGSNRYDSSTAQTPIAVLPWRLVISTTVPDAALVSFNGQTYVSDSSGQVTVAVNASGTYPLAVISPVEVSAGTRMVFVQWGDNIATMSRMIQISSDVTLSITTKVQYLLTLQSPFGNPTGAGWYDVGSTAQISIESPIDFGNGTRVVCSGWTGGTASLKTANTTVQMSDPLALQSVWRKQYFVSVDTEGRSSSGSGWYDAGSYATIKVSPTTYGFLIQQVFEGWKEGVPTQGGVSTIQVNGPVNLHAVWGTDYTQLIIVLAIIAGSGGAGGFVWRSKKGPARVKPVEPEQEPKEVTKVRPEAEKETGTSIYAPTPCPKCGLANPMNATYCAYCGTSLEPQKN